MKFKIVLLLIALFVLGCNKKPSAINKISNVDTLNQNLSEEKEESFKEDLTLEQPNFSKTGKTIEDFVLEPYEIQMKAEGFLNDDTLKDVVLVLQNKNDVSDNRVVLVLLKQEKGGFKLHDTSWEALEPYSQEDGFVMYDHEKISIDNKTLHILLQGTGPVVARETLYKYIDNVLVLVGISTFHSGAGSFVTSNYNLISGEADHELANTINDSMPSDYEVKKKFQLKRKMLFASDNPNTILESLPHAEW